jgi:hypothetical protein
MEIMTLQNEILKHQNFVNSVKDYIKECRENGVNDNEILLSFKEFLK